MTLLDYLGVPKPKWMSGMSFLNSETPVDRQIISITAASPTKINPPFYQIKTMQVQVCQKSYSLNVQDNTWNAGIPAGYTSPCAKTLLPSEEEIRQTILDYLEKYGYDISSLK